MFGTSNYLLASRIIKILHLIIASFNTIAIYFLFVYQPIYVAMTITTMLCMAVTDENYHCILTKIENQLRLKAGVEPLNYFLEDLVKRK